MAKKQEPNPEPGPGEHEHDLGDRSKRFNWDGDDVRGAPEIIHEDPDAVNAWADD